MQKSELATDEQAILGVAMSDQGFCKTMLDRLTENNFRKPENARVYLAIKQLTDERIEVSPLTVNQIVQNAMLIEELDSKRPLTTKPEHFINSILERDWRSDFQNAAQPMANGLTFDPSKLMEVWNRRPNVNAFGEKAETLAPKMLDLACKREDDFKKGIKRYISTGWTQIDSLTTGLRHGSLTVLAGRPGSGKTAIGLDFAKRIAEETPTLYFTWEMTREEIAERLIASFARVETQKIFRGVMNDREAERYVHGCELLKKQKLEIFHAVPNLSKLCAEIRSRVLCDGVKCAFVDYAGLIKVDKDFKHIREAFIEITKTLKSLAQELQIAVVLLAQARRPPPTNEAKVPTMGDLKESGSLEEDADNVILIWKREEDLQWRYDLLVAKARNGRCGRVPFNADYAKNIFEEIL